MRSVNWEVLSTVQVLTSACTVKCQLVSSQVILSKAEGGATTDYMPDKDSDQTVSFRSFHIVRNFI